MLSSAAYAAATPLMAPFGYADATTMLRQIVSIDG